MTEKEKEPILCGPCNYKHITKPAKEWCPECNEGMCDSCCEQHRAFAITRKHEVIDIENHKKLPDFVLNIDLFCEEHNNKVEFYCLSHNVNCCLKCVPEKHKECPNVTTLEMVAKDSKSSTALEDIFQGFEDLVSNMNEAIQIKIKNVQSLEEQKLKFANEIKSSRLSLNDTLDKLESRTLHNLDTIFSRSKATQQDFLKGLNTRKDDVEQFHHQCKDVKAFASEVQTFLGLKKMSEKLEEEEKKFLSQLDDTEFQNVSLTYEANAMLKSLQSGKLKNLGNVSEIANKVDFKFSQRKQDQAQVMPIVKARPTEINKISLRLSQQITLNSGKDALNIKDCAFFPDNRIAFTDFSASKRLLISTPSNGRQESLTLPFSPSGIDFVDDQTIAILCGDEFHIRILRLSSEGLEKEVAFLRLQNRGWSVSHSCGKLAVSVKNHGIRILNKSWKDLAVISINHNSPIAVHLNGNQLYYVDSFYHTVHCFSLKGQEMWKCQLPKERNQYSVTSDENNVVYVSCSRTNKIIIISADGSNNKQISIGSEDFNLPIAIAFNKNQKELLCATSDGTARLYSAVLNK